MDSCAFRYVLVNLVLISAVRNEEPVCGSACAPRFEHDYQVLQKLADLETRQNSLEETITNQQNLMASQENVIEILRQTLAGCIQTSGKNDNYAVVHDFTDQLAQSTCTAILEKANHVYAVRRQCSRLSSDCETVCSNLGKKCFNALHVYDVNALSREAKGTAGLHMYKYNNCGGGCGPNFCCCAGS